MQTHTFTFNQLSIRMLLYSLAMNIKLQFFTRSISLACVQSKINPNQLLAVWSPAHLHLLRKTITKLERLFYGD